MYCKVAEHGGYWSNGNTRYDITGRNTSIADYPASEVTFQINKNKKIEVCFRYYNLRDAITKKPVDYYIL